MWTALKLWFNSQNSSCLNRRIYAAYCELFGSYSTDRAVFRCLHLPTITLTPSMSLATVFVQNKSTYVSNLLDYTNTLDIDDVDLVMI